MYRRPPLLTYFILASLLLPQIASAQKHHKPKLNEDVPLPADFALDYQLGLAERSRIRGSSALLQNTAYNEAGTAVFTKLVQNPSVASLGLPYRWNFTIIDDGSVNAHSLPDGEVSVGSGLAKLIGTNRGLWSAVLSHETAHTARRHAVRKYLYSVYIAQQIQYYEARARAGDNSANWSLLALRIAAPIAAAKLSRNLEHDADIQGMMLMAREGYHPDYVFSLHHLLRAATGEQSKFAAFFSTHPRWETRDQRDDRAYADALAEYNRQWPDADASPGGRPPLVAFVGKPSGRENKQTNTADLSLPIYCRNATRPLQFVMTFRKDKRLIQTSDEQFRKENGELIFRQNFTCSEKTEATPIIVQLPATLVSKDDRKVEALVYVYSNDGAFLEEYKPFPVHFPKPLAPRIGSAGLPPKQDKSSQAAQSAAVAATEIKKEPDLPTQGAKRVAPVGTAAGGGPISTATSEKTSTLVVTSEPTEAAIYVDDSPSGIAPVTLRLNSGQRVIRAFKDGYQNWFRAVTVQADQNLSLTVIMQKDSGLSKQAEKVVASGIAQVPTAGGGPISTGPGENSSTIIVTSEPTGAAIYVDDSSVGIAPVTLKLKPGQHVIRAFKNGYQNWFRAVTVETGQNSSLTVTMQKSE